MKVVIEHSIAFLLKERYGAIVYYYSCQYEIPRASAYGVFITIQIVAFIATFINVEMIICHIAESPWAFEHKCFYKL